MAYDIIPTTSYAISTSLKKLIDLDIYGTRNDYDDITRTVNK